MMKFNVLLLVGILGAASAFASGTDCKREDHYPVVSREQLASIVAKKEAFIVDVNSAESFKEIHVPGAIHYGSHAQDFAQLLPKSKDALIVAYCGGPMCTAWKRAAEKACELGYTHIEHFKGGIEGWKKGS